MPRLLSSTYNLAFLYPGVAAEWDFDRNGELAPDKVTPGNHSVVWWKCPAAEDHRYRSAISNRASGSRCLCCANQVIVPSNSLAAIRPDIADQWDEERNGTLSPSAVGVGSHSRAHWICPRNRGHRWKAAIKYRTSGGGCPYCSNKRVSAANHLAAARPEIAAEWDHARNAPLTPEMVLPRAKRRVWWICQVAPDHRWQAPIARRTGGHGCPCCVNAMVVPSTSLAAARPDLAAQWDSERNGDLTPEMVSVGTSRRAHWACPAADDHRWQASVASRVRGHGCPCCAGIKLVPSNSLAATHPQVAAEWDRESNGRVTPAMVMRGCNRKFRWICGAGHRWAASPNARTRGPRATGCLQCSSSKGEREIGEELKGRGISFESQHSFSGCKNRSVLRFDFAVMLSGHPVALIEYQGEQHYRPVDFFGGAAGLESLRARDRKKRDYCRLHSIPLLEIPYTDRARIPQIVGDFLSVLDVGRIEPAPARCQAHLSG